VRLTAKKKDSFTKVISTYILTLPVKLATGLISILVLSASCEDPSNIGLELDPNSNQIGVFYQEIPLTAAVVQPDSIFTLNTGYLLAGHDEDDFFGKTEAIAYSRLLLPDSLPRASARLDSVKFFFTVNGVLTRNINTPKTIRVHLLEEQIQDVQYFSFSQLRFQQNPIISGTFNFVARQDTIVSVRANNAFTTKLFEDMKARTAFQNIFAFRNYFPGIAFTGVEEEKTSFTMFSGNNTAFRFYYSYEGDTASKQINIPTGRSTGLARHFNQIKNDPTGTPTAQVVRKNVAYDLGGRVGSKAGLGMLVRLNTAPLQAFLDTLSNVTFNQVILKTGPLETNIASYLPIRTQVMFFTNQTNNVLFRNDGSWLAVQPDNAPHFDPITNEPAFSRNPSLLLHDTDKNIFNQSITGHVNAIYRKRIPRHDLLLYPASINSQSPAIDQIIMQDMKGSLRQYVYNGNSTVLQIYYSRTRNF
jgi:hypothetical protein